MKKVVLSFFQTYEPAVLRRFENSSPKYEHTFNEECGLRFVAHHETRNDDFLVLEIVDEKKYFLAKIEYGFNELN